LWKNPDIRNEAVRSKLHSQRD